MSVVYVYEGDGGVNHLVMHPWHAPGPFCGATLRWISRMHVPTCFQCIVIANKRGWW